MKFKKISFFLLFGICFGVIALANVVDFNCKENQNNENSLNVKKAITYHPTSAQLSQLNISFKQMRLEPSDSGNTHTFYVNNVSKTFGNEGVVFTGIYQGGAYRYFYTEGTAFSSGATTETSGNYGRIIKDLSSKNTSNYSISSATSANDLIVDSNNKVYFPFYSHNTGKTQNYYFSSLGVSTSASSGTSITTSNISDATITFNDSSDAKFTYTGAAIQPAITVKSGSSTLTLNTDYQVSYSNNITVNSIALVEVTGIGNYRGTASANYTIIPIDMTSFDTTSIVTSPSAITFNGTEQKPDIPTISYNGLTLSLNSNYILDYPDSDYVSAGNKNIKITFIGIYSGTVTYIYKILQKNISSAAISILPGYSRTYTGEEIKPSISVNDSSTTLLENVDYTISYENNINVSSTAKAIITGIGNYEGSNFATFEISKAQYSGFSFSQELTLECFHDTSLNLNNPNNLPIIFTSEDENIVKIDSTKNTIIGQNNTGSAKIFVNIAADNNHFEYAGTINVKVTCSKGFMIKNTSYTAFDVYTCYSSLLECTKNVKTNEEILVKGQNEISNETIIDKNIKITSLNGGTIKRATNYTGNMISVEQGCTPEIDLNIYDVSIMNNALKFLTDHLFMDDFSKINKDSLDKIMSSLNENGSISIQSDEALFITKSSLDAGYSSFYSWKVDYENKAKIDLLKDEVSTHIELQIRSHDGDIVKKQIKNIQLIIKDFYKYNQQLDDTKREKAYNEVYTIISNYESSIAFKNQLGFARKLQQKANLIEEDFNKLIANNSLTSTEIEVLKTNKDNIVSQIANVSISSDNITNRQNEEIIDKAITAYNDAQSAKVKEFIKANEQSADMTVAAIIIDLLIIFAVIVVIILLIILIKKVMKKRQTN